MSDGSGKRRTALILGAVVVAAAAAAALIAANAGREPVEPAPLELGPETVSAPAPTDVAARAGAETGTRLIAYRDDALAFETRLPRSALDDPLVELLAAEAEAQLAGVRPEAQAAMQAALGGGGGPHAWDIRSDWSQPAHAGDLVSYVNRISRYEGGAHPTSGYDGRILRRSDAAEVSFAEMFAQRTVSPAFVIAACEALKIAKTGRVGEATIFGEAIECAGATANIKLADAEIALAPSDEPSRFGGAYVLYAPYLVGPYVEGPYALTVSQAVFVDDLAPDFRPLFAGSPPMASN
jgi:hypothetical protein